jgi:hypothetical protein
MSQLRPYDEEADFWDNLDTGELMGDDGEWLQLDTPCRRAVRVAILPEIVDELASRARLQGVSVETLANAFLIEYLRKVSPSLSPAAD